jgi:hypothetical protein
MPGENSGAAAAEAEIVAGAAAATAVQIQPTRKGFIGRLFGGIWWCTGVVCTPFIGASRRVGPIVPWMAYVLPIYVAIVLWAPDTREVLYQWGHFKLTLLDLIYPISALVAMMEYLRVTHPGVDNSSQVNRMYITAVAYFGLFLVGVIGGETLGGGVFEIFSRTEFFWLLVMSATQALMASKLNSRTATRGMSFENHH